MTMTDTMTEEERLLELEEEADALRAAIVQRNAQDRTDAIVRVHALIAAHELKRSECESVTWRKREFKARGPRKLKNVIGGIEAMAKAA